MPVITHDSIYLQAQQLSVQFMVIYNLSFFLCVCVIKLL